MVLCAVEMFALVCDPDRSLSLLWRHAHGFECLCLRFMGHFDFAPLRLTAAAALCFCF